MRIGGIALAGALLAGCSTAPGKFVKPSLPGRACSEECLIGEFNCVSSIAEPKGYFFFVPFVLGNHSPAVQVRACELQGRICLSRCDAPGLPPAPDWPTAPPADFGGRKVE